MPVNPPVDTESPSATQGATPTTQGGGIYLNKALERLKTPRQLDDLVRIVPSLAWLVLLTIVLILVVAIAWSFLGRIPKTVQGKGIIINGGQISAIASAGTGLVQTLNVKMGDDVKKDQIVATVIQPVLAVELKNKEAKVQELKRRAAEVKQQSSKLLEEQLAYSADQRTKTTASIADYKDQIGSLVKVYKAQQELLQQGLISLTTSLSTRNQLQSTQINLLTAESQLRQLIAQDESNRVTAKEQIFNAESDLQTAQEELDQLQAQLHVTSFIRSPYNGTICGINVSVGTQVNNGDRMFDVQDKARPLMAVLYFPAGSGKKIQLGMKSQVSPDTVAASQYGFIVGKISDVAEIPARKDSMEAVLSNQQLVSDLLGSGPILQVVSELQRGDTYSGFDWSSSAGPRIKVGTGTTCTAKVIVKWEMPAELVIPLLKQLFGVVD
jgi:HlyD family secretion protein